MSNIQQNIERLIRTANCTVTDLARAAGVHRRTVDRLRGNSADAMFGYKPTEETVSAFSNLFGKSATTRLKSDEIRKIAESLF